MHSMIQVRAAWLALRNGRGIVWMTCREGSELPEHPIFDGLPRDEQNLVPRH